MSVPECFGARGVGFRAGWQHLELFDQYSDRLLIGAHFTQLARVVMNLFLTFDFRHDCGIGFYVRPIVLQYRPDDSQQTVADRDDSFLLSFFDPSPVLR
jgi:hypothetical protein